MGKKARKGRRKPSKEDAERAQEARRIADQAIFRLNILEYVILGAAALLALLGGALVAWILGQAAGLPFRWTWALASLLLFIIPGGSVYLRELRRGRRKGPGPNQQL